MASVNTKHGAGWTPLSLAVVAGHADNVAYLLKHGADVNIKNHDGKNAIDYALENSQTNIVAMLRKAGATATPPSTSDAPQTEQSLITWAKLGNTDKIEAILARNTNVDEPDRDGKTALMWAAERGRLEAVNILLKHGADVNAVNSNGWTALMGASASGNTDIVQLLIQKKADINASNSQGWNPLILATCTGHQKTVDILLKSGADPSKKNYQGKTALQFAKEQQNTLIQQLIEKATAKNVR